MPRVVSVLIVKAMIIFYAVPL